MDSQFAQQAHRDYVENLVFSAQPAERVDMLYKIAVDSVNAAIARLKEGDIFARGRAVNKAHEAVDELIFALDHSVGVGFTRTLAGLYNYIQRELVKGHSQKSERAFQDALAVLTTLAEAWKEVVTRTCSSHATGAPARMTSEAPEKASQLQPVGAISEPHAAYGGMAHAAVISRDWSG